MKKSASGKRTSLFPSMNLNVNVISFVVVATLIVCAVSLWSYSIYKRYIIRKREGFASPPPPPSPACKTDLELPFNPNILPSNDDIPYSNEAVGAGSDPWMHHKVQGSLPVDPKVIYPKAYYYEYDNTHYLSSLRVALATPCVLLADAVKTDRWSNSYTIDALESSAQSEVVSAYQACVDDIKKHINASPALMLPGDIEPDDDDAPKNNIQVVHDILKSYKKHLTERQMYLIDIELLLYRENKFHGKHVKITCTAKKSFRGWFTNVIAVDLIGVVPEDQIGLFPVSASRPST